jgi:hypothetical protein
MNVYKYVEEQTDLLFDFILEFFGRDTDTASVAWYFFLKRKIARDDQTEAYKILTRIAKLKYGIPKKKPSYDGEVYRKAYMNLKKIIKWIQKDWMKSRHRQINTNSKTVLDNTFKLLNSTLPLAREYAILFDAIVNWKPYTALNKKQIL